ncbi:MAG: S41 family peptidase [Prevotellaceae bacterium]|jgi:carboxyl-terminal processing protease|nr:S41 family peptidase [Prevotellaceae bacterium]
MKHKYTISKKLALVVLLTFCTATIFASSASFRLAKNIDVFFSILQELDLYYVDTIDHDRMITGAINDMLESLDPYTVFIPESEVSDFDFTTTGQYGGIGALIRKRSDGLIEVVEPYEKFPADRAGVKAGDVVLMVDSVHVNSKNVSDVSASLKGQRDTEVTLKLLKLRTKDTVSIALKRAQVQLPSVPYSNVLDGGVGYIYFSTFTKDCAEEVKSVVAELKKKGATSLIFDLRSNTGGLLDEAVKLVNLFVPRGQEVVSVRGRVGGEKKYKTESRPLDVNIPLVVLINSMSASSSEIVAGALQDLDRAVIVGQRSYGKGLVQSVRSLPFNEKLKITTAKYYTPSNRCVQAIDYTHRNPDGSVGKIPDSLVHKFTTRAGRTVFDGGGITPDETIPPTVSPQILQRLYEQNLFFDFASQFYIKNDTIEIPSKFRLKDSDYQEFIDFVKQAGFTYETASSHALNMLTTSLKKEKYYEDLAVDLQTLSEKVRPDVEKDLLRFKSDIVKLLEAEIAVRYYYQRGRMEVSTSYDAEVMRAREILLNGELYSSFLQKKDSDTQKSN